MNAQQLYEAIGNIRECHIEAAHAPVTGKRPSVVKWCAVAACLVLMGMLGFRAGWFGIHVETAMLPGGETITFHKTTPTAYSLDLAADIRTIPSDQLSTIFGPLPITANAYYVPDENRFLGLEGSFADMKLVISMPELQLLDAVVEGREEPSMVGNIPITAGYFVTRPNSQNRKTVIYYAVIPLDHCTIYLEHAGAEEQRRETREALLTAVQQLLASPLDFGVLGS